MRLIAGLATLFCLLCCASAASAHASLVAAEPGDGSVMASAPPTVQLRFNEVVTPAVVRLIDAQGKTRDDAIVRTIDATIVITLPENLPRGTQVISYRVISADGHPVGGSLVFSIGAVTGKPSVPAHTSVVAGLIWLARIGVYLGLFAGVGGAFFASWIAPARDASNVIITSLIVGILIAIASLGLQGLDVLDLPLADIAISPPWRAALATSLGPSSLIAMAAMAVGLVAQRSRARLARLLSALAITGVGLSLAASGHAGTAPPPWLTRPMLFLHGVGVAYWAGALAPLLALAWRSTPGLLSIVNRFSRIAVPVVGWLALSGLVLAIVQVQTPHALVDTPYGMLLSIKLALVAVLLGLAALNRLRLTPALARDPPNTRALARSILAECVVVVAILAVVAGWRFTPPPRAVAAVVTPLAIHIHTDQAMFQVLISPAEVGIDSFVLQLMNGEGSPLQAKEATLTLSLPARGVEPLERAATRGPDGYWHVRDVPLPMPGRWHIRVDALVGDFERITLEDDFDVPAR